MGNRGPTIPHAGLRDVAASPQRGTGATRFSTLLARMATVDSSAGALASYAGAETAKDLPTGPRQKLVGRIGPWQLVRLLHESELARVYCARPAVAAPDSPANYVVKVLRKEWWRDPHAIEMQRRAAWAGGAASHPHLLPVLSAGVEHPPFYFVTPRIAGRTLASVLEKQPRLPVAAALWIARQVAEALDALHAQTRMIHSDVKPANVIVGPGGHATLIDLGFVQSPQEGRHWSTRPVYGTLNYLAPECLTSTLGAAPQSDLYSLGVTLYEMLAGRLPFAGRDAEQLLRLHRESQPTPLAQLREDVPPDVATLVARLLAKDPLRRPDSARELVETLVRLEIESFSAR
jgi:serine/threonine-protein kinase